MSETRLTSPVSDDVLRIADYSFLRRDASATKHTGMAVYVHETIRVFTSRPFDLEFVHVESIWLQVKTGRGPPIFLAFIHRNPSSSFVWFDEFARMTDKVRDHKHTNDILLLGDLDMFKSNPAWASTLSLFNLHQCVQSATRVTLRTPALIDHIYVNDPNKMIRTYVPDASISDHNPVYCALYCKVPKPKNRKTHDCNAQVLQKRQCRCFSQ